MVKEYNEHMSVLEDIQALDYAQRSIEPPLVFPFPLEGKLKEEVMRIHEHIKKYETVDMEDTILIPRALQGESFDDRLKKIQGYDIEELKRQCINSLI